MAVVNQFRVKDATEVRDDICRTMRNGLIARGVANPNVTPGSDIYLLGTAVGNELAVVGANVVISNDEQMPDTASIQGLTRIGNIISRKQQKASGSVGQILISSSATTSVVTGATLVDDVGLRYEVVTGGAFSDGDAVDIRAIDFGAQTNHEAGDTLRWSAAPPFCDEKVTVGPGGLINGIDTDDTESYRARIIATYQNPPGSSNWEDIAEDAEDASGAVQKSFVFPTIYGPCTNSTAVVAAPTKTSKSRVVASTTVTNIIRPYVVGKHPPENDVTSVTDSNADVAIALSLPDAPTASPPGLGGGWKDGSPWPRPDGSSTYRCTVTAVTNTTQFTVDAAVAPTAGVSRIAWLSPFDWKLYQAVVTLSSGSSGAYLITIDRPFVGIAVGCYIWPDIEIAQTFVDALLASFALMGPGEKTDNATVLARGFRHPPPSVSWPSAIGPSLLNALTKASSLARAAAYLHRTDGTTTLLGNAGELTPALPGAVTDPPRIFVPRHIGLYRAP